MQKKIFLLPARPLRIITMFAVSLLLALPSGADEASEGRTLIDWYSQVPSIGVHNVYFQLRKDAKHLIVDSQTDPPSPFPEGREALFIQSGGDPGAFAAITMDPFFQDTHPPKGWMEIDFAVTRMIGIELSVDSSTEESPASHPDHDGRSLFNLLLSPDFAVLVRKEGEKVFRTNLSPPIDSGSPHVLRIEWDWTSDSPGLRFFLDGEPYLKADGEPAFVDVESGTISKGIDRLSIQIYPECFLGRITVATPE